MSAIVALFHRTGGSLDSSTVAPMQRAASHRAVDGESAWAGGPVALAHQHFAITPEEQALDQPLYDAETGCVISSDARIDNRAELLERLCPDHPDRSDTELILAAYLQWGESCANHLLGDFAFVIWDQREHRLFCARDPLGVRDLCYYIDTEWCVVASEPQQVAAHPTVPRRIDETRIAEFLTDNWSASDNSFFQEIRILLPGHILRVSSHGHHLHRYHAFDLGRTIRYKDQREYEEHFRELLTRAVRDRLRIVGKLGISLSGGPDSASIAALMRQLMPAAGIHSFSYVFDHYPECDERRFIEPVVRQLRLHPTYILGDDLWPLRDLDTWPIFPAYPAQDPYVRLRLAIMRAASESGCRILLNGHFGDNLFSGSRYWAVELLRGGRLAKLARLLAESPGRSRTLGALTRHMLSAGMPLRLRRIYRQFVSPPDVRPDMLTLDFIARTGLAKRLLPRDERNWGVPFHRYLRLSLLTMPIPGLGDSAFRFLSNGYGIEFLQPYWDRRLVEFLLAIPADRIGTPPLYKGILHRSLRDILPPPVLERPDKTGLIPLAITGIWKKEWERVRQILTRPRILETGWIRQDWLREIISDPGADPDKLHPLWKSVTLELWLRQYW